MVDTHRQAGDVRIVLTFHLLCLKRTGEVNDVGTTSQMTGFGEVAIGEDMAGAQMDEPRTVGKLTRHRRHIVLSTC